ncbi:MAG TPA: ABC transporter substrate-binding protein, partial [Acidobacteriota bacterium]|nr:ABC transporter substrate-binding protein [Acidobacteriota bacterium]
AEDVLFTMQIINDPNIATPARDSLAIDGKAIQWKKIDDHTITARLPAAFAPFLRKLDGAAVPILPRHKWQLLYEQGKFNEAMPVTMNMTEFVGLGPFLPRQYHAGQSLTLFRNPLYWKKDRHGAQLPYLDEITFLIVPDLNQLQLKIENGEIDTFQSIRPEDVERLKDPSSVNRASLLNLGASYDLEGLFFNQNAETNPATGKHYLDPTKRRWFTNRNFRKAISFAIDRDTLVKNIFFGMAVPATGVESPGNKLWFNPQVTLYPHDLKKALALLRDEGFVRQQEPSGRLKLLDKNGNEVRFALHTNAGNNLRNAQCIAIKSDLAKLGIAVEYSALDFNSLIAKITQTYDFDAILLGMGRTDVDPATRMSLWLSSGSNHFWWPRQKSPQTAWEKRIDDAMRKQLTTYDYAQRKKYYDEVQAILADELPLIYTINELIWVYAKRDLGNLKPSVSRHRTLWNAEELYWTQQTQ